MTSEQSRASLPGSGDTERRRKSLEIQSLLDLTDDVATTTASPPRKERECRPNQAHVDIPSRQRQDARCQPTLLAGCAVARGQATATKARACDNLVCLECGSRVVAFDHLAWKASVDYLFLRNNFPDFSKLRAGLDPAAGSRAYACMCARRSVGDAGIAIKTEQPQMNNLSWTCMKH